MARIVITGMGVVTPLGVGVRRFWQALCEGRSGIRPIARFDAAGFAVTRAGEVDDAALPPDGAAGASADPAARFMLAAAREALADAGLGAGDGWRDDAAVVLSTNFGGVSLGEALLTPGDSPERGRAFADSLFQRAADRLADAWSLGGPRVVLSLSCASGTAALGYAAGLIRSGRARVAVTGGFDALTRFAWSGLSALRTMTADEVRPFDRGRSGTIFSEGAGAIVIEDEDGAIDRGAPVYAELAGFAANNNGHHMTAPAKEGAGSAAVMRAALDDAAMAPGEIDHINAHGTGTKSNDSTESQAIHAVFGALARSIPVTSIKSMTGHMMGAAGSVEAVASVLSLRDGVIPPTINFREPDPECDVDCVANAARTARLRAVLSNSAGIGGCNAAVIVRAAGRGGAR